MTPAQGKGKTTGRGGRGGRGGRSSKSVPCSPVVPSTNSQRPVHPPEGQGRGKSVYVVESSPARAEDGKLRLTLKRPAPATSPLSDSSSCSDSSSSGSGSSGSESDSESDSSGSSSGSDSETEYQPFKTYPPAHSQASSVTTPTSQPFLSNGSSLYGDNPPPTWLSLSNSGMSNEPMSPPSLLNEQPLASNDAFMMPPAPFSDSHSQILDMMPQSPVLANNAYMSKPAQSSYSFEHNPFGQSTFPHQHLM